MSAILSAAEMTPVPMTVDDRAQIAPPSALQRGDRERLPRRRRHYTTEVEVGPCAVKIGVGFAADGRVLEVWIDVHKEGATYRAAMNDLARSMSLALQLGGDPAKVASLYRHTKADPSGVVTGHEAIKSASSLADLVAQVLLHEAGAR